LRHRCHYTGCAPRVPLEVVVELEVGRRQDRLDLIGPPEAHDRAVHGRVAKRPRDRHRTRRGAVALSDALQPLDELEAPREVRLPEALAAPAPVVVRQPLDPLARHLPGQHPGGHRRVDDHADPLALAERQDLVLDLTVEQRVRRLQRLDRRDRLGAAQLPDREVRGADVTDEAFVLQLGEGRPALLELLVRDREVDLVEVDRLDAEAAQAGLALASERVAPQRLQGRAVRAFRLAALREDERPLVEARDRAADDLLRVAEPVLRGRVDPVDAELKRAVDRGDRLLVVLLAPAPVVLGAADRPGAEADPADLQPGAAELGRPHTAAAIEPAKARRSWTKSASKASVGESWNSSNRRHVSRTSS